MRVDVELFRSPEGRLEGEVRAAEGTGGAFSGVLELLRILETLDLGPRAASPELARPRPGEHGNG